MINEEIILEGDIPAKTLAQYLWDKCLSKAVKQHQGNLYSMITTFLQTSNLCKGNNRSFIPCKINNVTGKPNDNYKQYVQDFCDFFANKKINVSRSSLEKALEFYGSLCYGPAAKSVGFSVVTESFYFGY